MEELIEMLKQIKEAKFFANSDCINFEIDGDPDQGINFGEEAETLSEELTNALNEVIQPVLDKYTEKITGLIAVKLSEITGKKFKIEEVKERIKVCAQDEILR